MRLTRSGAERSRKPFDATGVHEDLPPPREDNDLGWRISMGELASVAERDAPAYAHRASRA